MNEWMDRLMRDTASDNAFDLVEQPWLLVETLGGEVREVSLLELFAEAYEYRRLLGDIPTQSFALLRLALAILYPALRGPETVDDWAELWREDELPIDRIDAYLRTPVIRDRFDLLHPRTPFYQVADLHTAKREIFGLEKLIADVPSGHRYFTTRIGPGLERIGLAEAARWTVHCQAFDVSGIKSGAVGDKRVKGGKGYPIGLGHCGALGGLYAEGQTLHETMLLNLLPLERFEEAQIEEDLPMWERAPLSAAEEVEGGRPPYGPLDLYTWQSRRIRLFTDADGVTGVVVANGDKITPHNRHAIEPMTAWRRSRNQEKIFKQVPVYLPRLHDPAKSLWRGLAALLPHHAPTSGREAADSVAPRVLTWLTEATRVGVLDDGHTIHTRATGMEYGSNNSVTDEVVDDSLTMACAVLIDSDDNHLRVLVEDAVRSADDGATAVARFAGDLAIARGADPDTARSERDSARETAFSALDKPFRSWLSDLTPGVDAADARRTWHEAAATALRQLINEVSMNAGPGAWVGREIDGRLVDSSLAASWCAGRLRKAFPDAFSHLDNDDPETT